MERSGEVRPGSNFDSRCGGSWGRGWGTSTRGESCRNGELTHIDERGRIYVKRNDRFCGHVYHTKETSADLLLALKAADELQRLSQKSLRNWRGGARPTDNQRNSTRRLIAATFYVLASGDVCQQK